MSTQNRFAIFDLVKLILASLVINLHVESFLTGAPFSPLYYLGKFAVPLFIIFNFYFNGKYFVESTKYEGIVHKLKRILFPFAVWSLVGFMLSPQLITLKYLARQITMGTAVDAPLYYLLAVFWISLAYYLLSSRIKKISFIHLGIIAIIFLYEILGFNKIIANKLPIQIEFFVSRTLEFTKYASLGIILNLYQDKLLRFISKYLRLISRIALVSPLILTFIYFMSGKVDINYSDPWLFLISALITVVLMALSQRTLPTWLGKVAHFGTYSLGLYCLHSFFIDLIKLHLTSVISFGYLLISLVVILFSLVTSLLIARLPKLKPLVQ